MESPGALSAAKRKILQRFISAHTTAEDLDMDRVVAQRYGGNLDKYLLDMARYFGWVSPTRRRRQRRRR
jgi:hypothetical protein